MEDQDILNRVLSSLLTLNIEVVGPASALAQHAAYDVDCILSQVYDPTTGTLRVVTV